MKHPVEKERGKKFVGLPEFAAVCERVMSELDFEQVRGTVTCVPDERTIRYYMSEGLIQLTEERLGSASVFDYLNLLQLVAVKKLQTEHLPIRKIRELVAAKNEQELESLLGVGGQSGKRASENEAKRYLESLLTPTMSQGVRLAGSAPPTRQKQRLLSSRVQPLPRRQIKRQAGNDWRLNQDWSCIFVPTMHPLHQVHGPEVWQRELEQ